MKARRTQEPQHAKASVGDAARPIDSRDPRNVTPPSCHRIAAGSPGSIASPVDRLSSFRRGGGNDIGSVNSNDEADRESRLPSDDSPALARRPTVGAVIRPTILRKPEAVVSSSRPLLCTRDAAMYCGYKTPGALRKAFLDGKVRPAGRRGGTGTWMWSVVELDRFLHGHPAAIVDSERSGAPPSGGAHDQEKDGVEVGSRKLDINEPGAARGMAAKGGRACRSRSGQGRDDGPTVGHMESAIRGGRTDGPAMVEGRTGTNPRRTRLGAASESALRRLRCLSDGTQNRQRRHQKRQGA